MEARSRLTGARCILLAIEFATKADITSLSALVLRSSNTLSQELSLRILLTFLPEATEPQIYVPLLKALAKPTQFEPNLASFSTSAVEDLSDSEARRRVRSIELASLRSPSINGVDQHDLLTRFIILHAYRIDERVGLLPFLKDLVVPFLAHSEALRQWFISGPLPLQRFAYDFYPQTESQTSFADFQALDEEAAIDMLLSRTSPDLIGRDLRCLVSPWVYGDSRRKRRKTVPTKTRDGSSGETLEVTGWEVLNDKLIRIASNNISLVSQVVAQWDGPSDADYGDYDDGQVWQDEEAQQDCERQYAKAVIACIYNFHGSSREASISGLQILYRISQLMDFHIPIASDNETDVSSWPLKSFYKLHSGLANPSFSRLVESDLTDSANFLTRPSQGAVEFLGSCLETIRIMYKYGRSYTPSKAAKLCLAATAAEQENELKILIHDAIRQRAGEGEWKQLVKDVMRIWEIGRNEVSENGFGIFGRIPSDAVHLQLLHGILSTNNYKLATRLYIDNSPIPLDAVEKTILQTAMAFYDKSSNGNRTRGGMKRCSDILTAFYPSAFPSSTLLSQASSLVSATHALSFYSLILQQGAPFTPSNIRIAPQSLNLIRAVLDQNPRCYTKVDDLVEIGRNFAKAGLVKATPSSGDTSLLVSETESSVLTMCVEASLAAHDFDTAYSYVVNRLNISAQASSDPTERESHSSNSYKAAFIAGRYRAPDTGKTPSIRTFEMRLELLSLALLLAPSSALPEILATWRRSEEELNSLRAKEDEAELTHADKSLPSTGYRGGHAMGFVSATGNGKISASGGGEREAPMGLFDVARGAAQAFGKTAFPLRSSGGAASAAGGHVAGEGEVDESERVRKRDVVSNMVTGGLASGIGWVLGAQPVSGPDDREEHK